MSERAAWNQPVRTDGVLSDEELLTGLNPAQREAVLHFEGPILVLAGAGSGKTRVLTSRIARLIAHEGVPPSRILAVTFTNKAAGEMRERISARLGHEPAGLWVGTFHAIGARLLRLHPAGSGRDRSFTIYDQDDTLGVIKRLMDRHRLGKQFTPKGIAGLISDAKNAMVSPGEYETLASDPFARAAAVVYRDLELELRRANAVDFDDLLVLPVQLLRRDEVLRERLQHRFHFLLVDEYQDTNRAQYEFVRLLSGDRRNLFVVGDDDQSIYGWRGADIRNILDFRKDFSDAAVVRLEENYRSTPQILALANHVISANAGRMGKTLRATLPAGETVRAIRTLDERDEADWIVEEMLTHRQRGGAIGDIAVLYRTNAQSRSLEEALRKRAIPYRLIGAVRFYDRREIRDLMAYLKLIANPADDEAFRRAIAVPRRGVGEGSLDSLAESARAAGLPMLAAASRSEILASLRPAARAALAEFVALITGFRERARESAVDELLRDIVEAIRYGDYLKSESAETAIDRLENVRELIAGAAETVADDEGEVGLRPLDHFLQRAALVAGVDQLAAGADAVTLMTLHNAKGLEFPVVFISGLEDGLFPLARAFEDPAMLEEERRLLYVGITRARRSLTLTYAEQRRRNGELMPSRQSSFIQDVPDTLLKWTSTIRVRSSGRSAYGSSGSSWNGPRQFTRWGGEMDTDAFSTAPSVRRPGRPVEGFGRRDPADESQVAAMIVRGARVRHRKFGTGTIAELSGSGRDAKVKIDFDDENIGRKTLVVAQANLEREDD
jgi:DNA helicase II / ATP-dependent DNA helicase PcrA